jgi:antitoxin component YwqK of YwqJK toxin-antitoxin module
VFICTISDLHYYLRPMRKFIAVITLSLLSAGLYAQTFQVFKGDTINCRDASKKQQGVWRKYYKNDTLASEMFYKNGRHYGTFRTFSENGKLQTEVKYRPGYMEIGDGKIFYEDGTVKAKGKYVNKQKDSTWSYYDEQGKLSSTEFFVKGNKEGISKVYFPDGKIAEESIFKNGKKNGPSKQYYPDGTPKVISSMKNGEYEGIVTINYPSGKVREQGRYVNGLREGKWIVNKTDGTLDHEENYKQGKILNPVAEKEEKLDESVIKGPEGK